MRTLSIATHKGGVGKTATAHALGAILAGELARRVLLVDLDPQASLTGTCGIDGSGGPSLADVLGDAKPGTLPMGNILQDLGGGLWLAPADMSLAASELGLVTRTGRATVLRRALGTVARRYDVCLIDCPPGLGMLTVNALVASDSVLIPMQPQGADLRALRSFLQTVDQVKPLNSKLAVFGILPTFYDARLTHHRDALQAMRAAGLPVMDLAIGRSVRVAEAAAAGQALPVYAPDNPQVQNYRQLAGEVIKWLDRNQT